MKLQIQSIQFDADRKLLQKIENKVMKLDKYFDHIIEAEVFLKFDNNHSTIKDKSVLAKVFIPGKTLFAEDTAKLFEDALEVVVESLKRQLKKRKEKIRNSK
jgi:ribosome hibernation promoting factor